MKMCDSSIPKLFRILSTQHWVAAEIEMLQKGSKSQWAGTVDRWDYRIERKNTSTNIASRVTYHDDVPVAVEIVTLPKSHFCLGKRKDRRRCHRKVYGPYCSQHSWLRS
jgi:hypothetical protein